MRFFCHILTTNLRSAILILFLPVILYYCKPESDEMIEPLTVVITATDVTTFLGSDGKITLDVTGGMPPYTFSWSTGDTTKDLVNIRAGEYSVVVKDAADSSVTVSATIKQPIPENVVMDVEGNFYTTVKIGNQTWMQQNLRVSVTPDSSAILSYAYNDDPSNVEKYGRLYTWDVAMNGSTAEGAQGICPTGWHVPSDGEWKILEMNLGMTQQEADISNAWRGAGVGIKLAKGGSSGYDAVYAGRRTNYGSYSLIDQYEYIWTSSESGQYAWRRCLEKGVSTVGRYNTFPKSYAFSIRCVKDN